MRIHRSPEIVMIVGILYMYQRNAFQLFEEIRAFTSHRLHRMNFQIVVVVYEILYTIFGAREGMYARYRGIRERIETGPLVENVATCLRINNRFNARYIR